MRKVQTLSILAGLLLAALGCHGKTAPVSGGPPGNGASAASSGAGSSSAASSNANAAADSDSQSTSADAAAARLSAAQKNDGRPVLVCFGDSLTAGLGTSAGQSYPDYLQGDLDELGYHYRVVNEGVSGNTTKDGVARLPEVLALRAKIAVVEFGGNDGLRGLRIEDSQANLDEIVRTLQGAGVKVVLAGITLPPDYGEDYIGKFDAMYSAVANKYRVPMLPFLLKGVYGVPGMMQEEDHTHATAKGNVVVANNVLGLVRPLLKKQR
jgi:acyl-CoA thioesterase I